MDGKSLTVERELKSKSANIIWSLISTPEGMAKWLADDVHLDDKVFTFTWGDVKGHHEIRSAVIVKCKEQEYIRLRWTEEEWRDTSWEMRMGKSDITGDYILTVNDCTLDGDIDMLRDIWESNFEALRRSTGL